MYAATGHRFGVAECRIRRPDGWMRISHKRRNGDGESDVQSRTYPPFGSATHGRQQIVARARIGGNARCG
jgi:hypothetical protein